MGMRKAWLLAASAATLVAGCSGNTEDTPPDAAPATTAAATAAPTAAAAAPTADSIDTVDGTTLASLTPNAENGKVVFLQCKTCHVLEAGQNRIGPSLAGIVGRAAGTVEGFSYTPANANSGITWTEDKLFQYLENPQRVVPGTKMAFAGLSKAQDRADVIAYLKAPTE